MSATGTSSREQFLQRVRQSVAEGNRPGVAGPLPARGSLGYQGAGIDPVARFCEHLRAAGGMPYLVGDSTAAAGMIVELVQGKSARKALIERGPVIDRLGLVDRLGTL